MIHAEKARELTEVALASLRTATLDSIEGAINKAANNGYNQCEVSVHENLVEDIEWTLQNYDYATCPVYADGKELLRISW